MFKYVEWIASLLLWEAEEFSEDNAIVKIHIIYLFTQYEFFGHWRGKVIHCVSVTNSLCLWYQQLSKFFLRLLSWSHCVLCYLIVCQKEYALFKPIWVAGVPADIHLNLPKSWQLSNIHDEFCPLFSFLFLILCSSYLCSI